MYDFTVREKKIINLLALDRSEFISGKQLSTITGVTERTIRSDIKNINSYLRVLNVDRHFHIDSVHSKGYILVIENEERFKEFSKDLHSDIEMAEREKTRFEIRMVRLLILLNKDMTVYKLSNIIGYSEQVISEIIKRNTNSFRVNFEYHFEIRNGRINVIGKEKTIRNRILNTIFVNPNFKGYPDNVKKLISDASVERIIYSVLIKTLSDLEDYSLSNSAISYIVKWLFISMKRESFGNHISLSDKEKELISKYHVELSYAKSIVKKLKEDYSFVFDDDDIYYVAAFIISFGDIKGQTYEQLSIEEKILCDYVCYLMQRDLNLDHIKISDIRTDLSYYFRAFKVRHMFNINRQYLGITRIKRRLITATEYGRRIANELKEVFNISISDKEIVFLSVCIAKIVEKCRVHKKHDILIISRYGYFEAKRFADDLFSEYNNYIDHIDFAESYEMDRRYEEYDMILTDDAEIARSRGEKYSRYWAYSTMPLLPKDINMKLIGNTSLWNFLSLINDGDFVTGLIFKNMQDLFAYLSTLYGKSLADKKDIVRSLNDSEKQMTLECGHNCALVSFIEEGRPQDIKFYILDKDLIWDQRLIRVVIVITGETYQQLQEYEIGLTHIMCDAMKVDMLINDPNVKKVKEILDDFNV